MKTEDNLYKELIDTLEKKFDAIEERLDYLLTRVNNGCYLCGNRTPTCKLTDCPHENNYPNPN